MANIGVQSYSKTLPEQKEPQTTHAAITDGKPTN